MPNFVESSIRGKVSPIKTGYMKALPAQFSPHLEAFNRCQKMEAKIPKRYIKR
ncbi:hypothetical protein MADA3029_610002 [Vibrio nigripulchritudo MADA3029]|nr:hypothetical protein VIBNIMADA3020_1210006 [Vibrio nigripulchritudo MADA3020]CCN53988.1 hypothetical protein VIBNIMADA3021_470002 [Vibrio nigripulchritudo MADA3021]CCN60642.1 hypothetical protein MADA3029_610002 [Vibrio nigripulchritudo MADA3029]